MTWQFTIWAVPLAATSLLVFALFIFTFDRRASRIAYPLMAALLASAIWAGADALRFVATSKSTQLLAHNLRFVGASFIVQAMFVLVLVFTKNDHWLTRRRLIALFVVPAATVVVAFTNGAHHLLRESVTMMTVSVPITGRSIQYLSFDYGPWYYLHVLAAYPLIPVTAYLLLERFLDRDEMWAYRMQSMLICASLLVPVPLNLPFVLDLTAIDMTAVGFGINGVLITFAVYRYQLLDIVPIARSTVVENMDGGVLVLDPEDQIVDVNPRGTAIMGIDRATAIDHEFETIFSDYPEIVDTFGDERQKHERLSVEREGLTRHYDVRMSPLYEGDRYVGRVAIFRDVTDQVETQQALERQNERLEEFANVVSHDLRNPINVARGNVELVNERLDDDRLDTALDAVGRMEHIVDDVLTLARQGQTVTDPEPVSLDTVAERAWKHVETAEASLRVTGTVPLEADESRLLHLFENLYRNAIEHAGDDVTVEVGPLGNGFYVADDGPGIPPSDREAVFDRGYTTSPEGTGFGLAITQTVADAHGWEITVEEADAGGARFEFRGVDVRQRPTAT